MKYSTGDKVKYNSGEWSFFGTVTAIIENSLCPCYRISVERMQKNNCQFSITQFEFEMESDSVVEPIDDRVKSDILQIEAYKTVSLAQKKATTPKVKKPQPEPITPTAPDEEPTLLPLETIEQPAVVDPVIPPPAKAKRATWDDNFESYQKGERSNSINTWIYQNRRQYKENSLYEGRLEKLIAINFPFNARPTKSKSDTPAAPVELKDIWHKQLRQWKSGDNRASLQQWRQINIKRYVAGKLSPDKIEKLKEAGILK